MKKVYLLVDDLSMFAIGWMLVTDEIRSFHQLDHFLPLLNSLHSPPILLFNSMSLCRCFLRSQQCFLNSFCFLGLACFSWLFSPHEYLTNLTCNVNAISMRAAERKSALSPELCLYLQHILTSRGLEGDETHMQ